MKDEKGSKGDSDEDCDNGTSCMAKSVKNKAGLEGVEVTCGKTVVDTIWNGRNGDNGNDGEGCTLKDNEDGLVTVSCGASSSETLYKAMCGTEPYEPTKSFCSEGELYSCNDKSYNPKKRFCDTRDNQIYGYVTIAVGDYAETWMAENLNYSVDPGKQSWCGGGESETTNEGECSVYGRLYTWDAAVDACPEG